MLYAIDASVYVFRAWFSVPDDMTDADGNPVNALYGFSRFLADFVEEIQPERIVVAFDKALESSFRNDIYPDYKANRDPAPPELERQFQQCIRFAKALGLCALSSSRYEADDIIGTSVIAARREGTPATIVSRDKDLVQLVSGDDVFWDFASRKRLVYNEVPEAYGVWPEQIPDFLALAGDSVDNIPGVPGVGKKTAAALLAHFGSLNVIYSNLDRVSEVNVRGAAKLGARLEEHREICELSRQLTGIVCDAPLDLGTMERRAPKMGEIYALCDEVGFGTGIRMQAQRIADHSEDALPA
ncbi:MAG: 5'-3' exonuclease H3TH domain-containing protein [Pseudomonadota bacterium]